MTRQSFSEDEFAESMTLQNVSANLETIKRMKGWSVMEMSKHIGISDRHLDSLLKMNSNVTVLVLEKIAEGLGISVLRLMGTRIVVNAHKAGADFLKEIRGDKWSITSEDAPPPPVRATRAETRKAAKAAGVAEVPEAPAGLEGLLQRIVDVQDRLAKDNSQTNAKVDKLSSQLESLVSAVKSGPAEAAASSGTGAKRGPKGPRKAKAAGEGTTASSRKGGRGGAALTVTGATSSVSADAQSGAGADDDLFDRSAPSAPAKRRGRPPNAESAKRPAREAALKSRGNDSVKTSKGTRGPGAPKRAYNRKK